MTNDCVLKEGGFSFRIILKPRPKESDRDFMPGAGEREEGEEEGGGKQNEL